MFKYTTKMLVMVVLINDNVFAFFQTCLINTVYMATSQLGNLNDLTGFAKSTKTELQGLLFIYVLVYL